MSDARLRELERRWRETGATSDEARLLRERVRTGALDQARLRLAARLGHAAAGEAAGAPSLAPFESAEALLEALAPLGPDAVVRLVVALATARAAEAASRGAPVGDVVATIRRATLQPEGMDRELAAAAALLLRRRQELTSGPAAVMDLLRLAAETLRARRVARGAYGDEMVVNTARACLPRLGHGRRHDEAVARATAELVPWLLGYADPLADPSA